MCLIISVIPTNTNTQLTQVPVVLLHHHTTSLQSSIVHCVITCQRYIPIYNLDYLTTQSSSYSSDSCCIPNNYHTPPSCITNSSNGLTGPFINLIQLLHVQHVYDRITVKKTALDSQDVFLSTFINKGKMILKIRKTHDRVAVHLAIGAILAVSWILCSIPLIV